MAQLEKESLEWRQSRLPKKLMSPSDEPELSAKRQSVSGVSDGGAEGNEGTTTTGVTNTDDEVMERENAQAFLQSLKEELSRLTSARGSVEIDQRLQEFASKFCHGKNINILHSVDSQASVSIF